VNIPYGTPVSVSTLAVLMPWQSLGGLRRVLFAVANLSSTETVTLVADTSEDKLYVDALGQVITIPPLSQGSLELGPDALRTFWRLSASTQGPAYDAALVKWMVSSSPT
jgi:hypothetical protein